MNVVVLCEPMSDHCKLKKLSMVKNSQVLYLTLPIIHYIVILQYYGSYSLQLYGTAKALRQLYLRRANFFETDLCQRFPFIARLDNHNLIS